MKNKHLPLGTKVEYRKVLVKMRGDNNVMWPDFVYEDGAEKGVIVGVRTLREGKYVLDSDSVPVFNITKSLQAYMVAQTLYRKPSFVPIDSVKEVENASA
jgi:hypothetical protein